MTVYVDDMKADFRPGHAPGRKYIGSPALIRALIQKNSNNIASLGPPRKVVTDDDERLEEYRAQLLAENDRLCLLLDEIEDIG